MQNRSQKTRERILTTSFNLFLQNGYDTTGVASICEHAKVSKGAFYHHFPSKHDLFLTILDSWIDRVENRFDVIQASGQSVPEQILAMAEILKEIFSEPANIPIFLEFWMQSMRDESVSQRTIAPYFYFLKYFESLLQKGISQGSLSADLDAAFTARLLMAYAMGSILQSSLEPQLDWQNISHSGVQTILQGLITKEK